MAATKKATKKVVTPEAEAPAKKTRAKRIKRRAYVLSDNILWAVVRKTWFGGGVVLSVHPTESDAEYEKELYYLSGEKGKLVVQRAPLAGVSSEEI